MWNHEALAPGLYSWDDEWSKLGDFVIVIHFLFFVCLFLCFLGGSSSDLCSGADSPDCPSRSGRWHCKCFSWFQDHAVSRQERSGPNSGLLHMVCGRWVTPGSRTKISIFSFCFRHIRALTLNRPPPPCALCPAVCYISAMTLSSLVNLVMLMRSMVLHRWEVQQLFSLFPIFLKAPRIMSVLCVPSYYNIMQH